MGWRRFAINHYEAEIVKMALRIYIHDIEDSIKSDVLNILPHYKASAENLLQRIETYSFWQE